MRCAPLLLPALLLAALVRPAGAQADDRAAREARAQGALRALESAERTMAAHPDSITDGERTAQQAALVAARAALDSAVLLPPWGGETLADLRRAYPESALLARYVARRALRDHQAARALGQYEALLRRAPRDVELLAGRATALDSLDRGPEARAAWMRVLDAEPEHGDAFERLLQVPGDSASREALLQQVRRLRELEPERRLLVSREIRVLQALGRMDEAAAVLRTAQREWQP